MTPVQAAEQALREGNIDTALKSLQDGVRAQPAAPKLRVFLFQLLCITGQWLHQKPSLRNKIKFRAAIVVNAQST